MKHTSYYYYLVSYLNKYERGSSAKFTETPNRISFSWDFY